MTRLARWSRQTGSSFSAGCVLLFEYTPSIEWRGPTFKGKFVEFLDTLVNVVKPSDVTATV